MAFLRSVARISIAVTVVAGLAFGGLAIAVRQPAVTTLPFVGTQRADPRVLRSHVEFLTTDVTPRSVSHPENLERAASYVEERFRAAGGHTFLQRFEARGHTFANVVARFGPDDPALGVELRTNCDEITRFPGTVGGGDLIVCEPTRSVPLEVGRP